MTLIVIYRTAYDNSFGANFTIIAVITILKQVLFQGVSDIICRGYDGISHALIERTDHTEYRIFSYRLWLCACFAQPEIPS